MIKNDQANLSNFISSKGLKIPMSKRILAVLHKIFVDETAANIDTESEGLILGLIRGVIFVACTAAILLILDAVGHSLSWQWLGTFGDFFGGVFNPILTFATLVALAITIIMQRAQMRHAQVDSAENSRALRINAFESTFFNMLNLHNNIVEHLEFDPSVIPTNVSRAVELAGVSDLVKKPGPPVHGRKVFAEVLHSIHRGAKFDEGVMIVYRKIQDKHNYVLGHYFRNLYQILNIINRFANEFTMEEARIYANILRAQLSSNELMLLFYNCSDGVVDNGRFKELVKKFRFLEHLPLTYNEAENTLTARSCSIDSESQYLQYLDRTESNGVVINSAGAFGSNPEVKKFLEAFRSIF